MPQTRRHSRRGQAPDWDVRLGPLPAGDPSSLPPARLGRCRRDHQDVPRQPRPRSQDRESPPASRLRPRAARARRDRRRVRSTGDHQKCVSAQNNASGTSPGSASSWTSSSAARSRPAANRHQDLAREAAVDRAAFYGTRPYAHLCQEFEAGSRPASRPATSPTAVTPRSPASRTRSSPSGSVWLTAPTRLPICGTSRTARSPSSPVSTTRSTGSAPKTSRPQRSASCRLPLPAQGHTDEQPPTQRPRGRCSLAT